MNTKAQTINIGITVLLAAAIFFAMTLFLAPLMELITDSRNDANINCAAPASDGAKVTCLGLDIIIPYFIIGVLSVAASVIILKVAT